MSHQTSDIVSAVKGNAEERVFTPFPRLPPELREKICKSVDHNPRVIAVQLSKACESSECYETYKFKCGESHAISFEISSEFRAIALISHRLAFPGSLTYFNPKYDILHFRSGWDFCYIQEWLLPGGKNTPEILDFNKDLKYIAFSNWFYSHFTREILQLQGLEVLLLSVVVGWKKLAQENTEKNYKEHWEKRHQTGRVQLLNDMELKTALRNKD